MVTINVYGFNQYTKPLRKLLKTNTTHKKGITLDHQIFENINFLSCITQGYMQEIIVIKILNIGQHYILLNDKYTHVLIVNYTPQI